MVLPPITFLCGCLASAYSLLLRVLVTVSCPARTHVYPAWMHGLLFFFFLLINYFLYLVNHLDDSLPAPFNLSLSDPWRIQRWMCYSRQSSGKQDKLLLSIRSFHGEASHILNLWSGALWRLTTLLSVQISRLEAAKQPWVKVLSGTESMQIRAVGMRTPGHLHCNTSPDNTTSVSPPLLWTECLSES